MLSSCALLLWVEKYFTNRHKSSSRWYRYHKIARVVKGILRVFSDHPKEGWQYAASQSLTTCYKLYYRQRHISASDPKIAASNKVCVSARSRKLILGAAKKLDFQTNMMARQFSSNRTVLPGMIAPFRGWLGTYCYGRVLQGVPQAVSGTSHHMVLFEGQSEDFNCA